MMLSLLLLAVPLARSATCPQADALLEQGQPLQAEQVARTCLADAPDDPGVLGPLARALSAQHRIPDALALVDDALARHPQDGDLQLLRLRLLAWSGDLDAAWAGVSSLPQATRQGQDGQDLVADLERWRAHEAARRARYQAWTQGGASYVVDRPWGLNGSLGLTARAWSGLTLGTDATWRRRDFGAGPLDDVFVQGTATWAHGPGFLLDGAAGGTPNADFMPLFSAWVEPGWSLARGLEIRARYWRMQHADGGTDLVSPAVVLYTRPATFTLRSYHGVDATGVTGSSVHGRVAFSFVVPHPSSAPRGGRLASSWDAWVGGGAGNRADFLTIVDPTTDRFWTAVAGLGWNPSEMDRVVLEATWRNEESGDQVWRELDLQLGYRRRF